MSSKGQCHSLTFDPYLTYFEDLKATLPIVTKFHIKPQRVEETTYYPNRPGHMINIVAMPIYGKNL